jgi:hypothetical protein
MAPATCAMLVSTVTSTSINSIAAAVSAKSVSCVPRLRTSVRDESSATSLSRTSVCRLTHSAQSPVIFRISSSDMLRRSFLSFPLPLHTRATRGFVRVAPIFSRHNATRAGSLLRYGISAGMLPRCVLKASGRLMSGQWQSNAGNGVSRATACVTPASPTSSGNNGGCASRITFAPSDATRLA